MTPLPSPAPVSLIDLEQENFYHWEISFEVKVDKIQMDVTDPETLKQVQESEETYIWIADVLNVRAGEDAFVAILKAKAHVLNESKNSSYELEGTEFKLTSVKLLSMADI